MADIYACTYVCMHKGTHFLVSLEDRGIAD